MGGENPQFVFRRGVMSLVVLSLLKRGDMYGYQLVQETERLSGGKLTTQEGSLYPVLYKLADQGLISDRRVQVGKRMTRVYYHLEPTGEQRLQELINEYRDVSQGVFQIIDGGDSDAVSMCAALHLGSKQSAPDEGQAEEEGPVPSGGRRLGLCY